MRVFKARVVGGRLTLDEPTNLPDGMVLELVPANPEDEMSAEEREELHASIRREHVCKCLLQKIASKSVQARNRSSACQLGCGWKIALLSSAVVSGACNRMGRPTSLNNRSPLPRSASAPL